jgi:putative pyoverdin transport system ATP-binding/permease protein
MNSLSYFWRTSPVITIVATVSGLLSGAGSIGLLSLINDVLSNYHQSGQVLGWWYLGLCSLILVTQYLTAVLMTRLSQGAASNLRLQLSRQILRIALRQIETLGPHRLLTALTYDVVAIAQLATFLPRLCVDFAIVAGCFIYLTWLSWKVLLFVLGFAVLGVGVYKVLRRRTRKMLDAIREEQDLLQKHFRALTEGTKELMLHRERRESHFLKKLEGTITSLRRHNVIFSGIFAGAASWNQIVFYSVVAVLLFSPWTGGRQDPQVMIGCILTVLFLRGPLEDLVAALPYLAFANVSMKKIEDLGLTLKAHPSNSPGTEVPDPRPDWKKLQLVGSRHSYDSPEGNGNKFVLGPLNLTFRRGELVFIAGGNGSGKTTFAKLLAGLYIPEDGKISIDGQPVDDTNRESYRQYFSAVFSDFYLFDPLLGYDGPDFQKKAESYLAQLQLDQKVQIREGAFSTTELSQGQRKRLALLTAYMENRQIYIFDEWAADQDPIFKDLFYNQILPELKSQNKTVFVISHDERYYSSADRVIKLECGKVHADYSPPPKRSKHTPEDPDWPRQLPQ